MPRMHKPVAAYAIQKSYRAYLLRKRANKKTVKTSRVKQIVQNMEPTRSDIFALLNDDISNASTLINNLTNITYNDDPSVFGSRQATKIKLMSFNWRGFVNVAGTATDNIIRLMIVKKTAQDGEDFDPRQCFLLHPGTSPAKLYCQINKRYCHCVWEKTFQLQNQDPSLPTNERYPTIPWRKLLNIHYRFPKNTIARYALTGNATNIQSYNEQYYFIGVSDSSLLTPELTGLGTVFFKNA